MIARWSLLAVIIFCVYSNTLNGPFLFDDESSIEKNSSIHSLWPLSSSLWAVRDTPTAGRPVVNFSFALNYAFGQQSVVGYHVVNIAIHIVNACLLYWLVVASLRTSSSLEPNRSLPGILPMMAVLMWAVHPLHTETVNYVTQRTELLMGFFFLLSMLSSRLAWDALETRSRICWQGLCVASCALGMASKEVMVVVPVMIILYDIALMNQTISNLWKIRRHFYLCLASTWIVLVLLLAANPRGRSVGFGLSIGFFEYITTQCWAVTQYLWLTIWPANLCGDYGVSTVTDLRDWLPRSLSIAILLGVMVWAWRQYRFFSFLGLWFFFILAPTSSIVPIVTEPIAERRVYLSLVAVILVLVGGVSHFGQRWMSRVASSQWRELGIASVCLAIAGAWACTSYARNEVYQSELLFWSDVIQKRPFNARGHQNLANALLERGQNMLALEHYQRSKSLAPTSADSYYNLGVWHMNHGDPSESIANFDQAISIEPDRFHAVYYRALLLSRLGRTGESINGYRNALRISPRSAMAHLNLGNCFFSQGQWDKAIEMYNYALLFNPQLSEAREKAVAALAQKGE